MLKRCAACGEAKPYDAFSRQTKSKDGRYPYCKACAKTRLRAAYQARGKASWVNDKTCSWCKVLKPKTEYRVLPSGKVHNRCKTCEAEIAAHEAHGERRCNICREWLPLDRFYASKLKFPHVACISCTRAQVAQPEYRHRRRDTLLQKEFGITLDQYKELLERQNHKCPVCLVPFEPDNFSYHVDHAHSGPHKGKVRAIVHSECNRTILWMHEDGALLRRAADLIENPLTDWVVPGVPYSEAKNRKNRQK
jgi:hypothetical protein